MDRKRRGSSTSDVRNTQTEILLAGDEHNQEQKNAGVTGLMKEKE